MAKTWLITGSSRGFGRELARAALERGTTSWQRPGTRSSSTIWWGSTAIPAGPSRSTSPTPRRRAPQSGWRWTRSVRSNGSEVLSNEVAPLGIKVTIDAPPLRLLLGAGAVASAADASEKRAAEVEQWTDVSRSAALPS